MRRLCLTAPNEIVEELQLFCLNKPKSCKKASQLGWTNNDRIVVVRNGYLEYYNHHLGFKQDDISSLNPANFKCAISLDEVVEVNYLPRNNLIKN